MAITKLSPQGRAAVQYERLMYIRESLAALSDSSKKIIENMEENPVSVAIAEADHRYANDAMAIVDRRMRVLKAKMTA